MVRSYMHCATAELLDRLQRNAFGIIANVHSRVVYGFALKERLTAISVPAGYRKAHKARIDIRTDSPIRFHSEFVIFVILV